LQKCKLLPSCPFGFGVFFGKGLMEWIREVEELLDNNQRWSEAISKENPGFFPDLQTQQNPKYLWIGCADSRVPANDVVGLAPGELFVHRNVANLVYEADINCLSVLTYAIQTLHIRHVILCGHYGCGGVLAAMGDPVAEPVQTWLKAIRELKDHHANELEAIVEPEARADRLCELNVLQQAANVASTSVLQEANAQGRVVAVHAWIYSLADGLVKDLRFPCPWTGYQKSPKL